MSTRIALPPLLAALCIVLTPLTGKQLPVKAYTAADGLPRDRVNCVLPDSHGFLWFCTAEGLSRFDGYGFTNYGMDQGLPARAVSDVLEMRNGLYLIAAGRSLSRFNPAHLPPVSNTFVNWNAPLDKNNHIDVLFQDRTGKVWCGTRSGLYLVEGVEGRQPQFRFIDLGMPHVGWDDSSVSSLLEDQFGTLWIGSGSGLYRLWAGGHVDHFTKHSGLPDNLVFALNQDRDGTLWAGTFHGLCRITAGRDHPPAVEAVYTVKDGLASNWITTLYRSAAGTLWIGTSAGLTELVTGTKGGPAGFVNYGAAEGIADGGIDSIREDRDGNLWVATWQGAKRIAHGGLTSYTAAEGIGKKNILALGEDRNGQLYAVTPADAPGAISGPLEIRGFDEKRFIVVRPRYPGSIDYFGWGTMQIAFPDRQGEWWIGTGRGLCRFPRVNRIQELASVWPKALYTTRDGLPGDDIRRIYEDSHGDIWISATSSSKHGISVWHRSTGKFDHFNPADGAVEVFREDRAGTLWMGLNGTGLLRYRNGQFVRFTSADGLAADSVRTIFLDHAGRLWIGTANGLSRVDEPAAAQPSFINYTTRKGLSNNSVQCLTEDRWHRVYVGTGRGLDRLDPDAGRIKHYTTADGLVQGDFQSAYCDRKGDLWFGTLYGLSQLVPEADPPHAPPPVLISSISIGGQPRPISALGETAVSGLVLAANQNHIQIDFLGLSFAPGEILQYQYILRGADRDWSPRAVGRSVSYANLAPGKYKFEVRAVDSDRLSSDTPATIDLQTLPPIWRRWWVQLPGLLLLAIFIYGVHRMRVARAIELERVRARIATDLHDDIGSSLSQVAILSEVVRRRVGIDEPQVIRDHSEKIATISRELVDSMSEIVWSINPSKDHFIDLTQRMRQFAGEMLTPQNVALSFEVSEHNQNLPLDANVRRQFFLIFKECLHNVVRHSGATKVSIEFGMEKNWLVLAVSDNGRGLGNSASAGHGIPSMRSRALALGGCFEIKSDECGGVRVSVRVLASRSRAATLPK